ncbi:hypothetical protein GA0115280_119978 [Streptomyces sp. Cmuel-A718b]|nr:hypothetical protein GA0115280_119978 [Streptomyces sp. Cmuel-A718b]
MTYVAEAVLPGHHRIRPAVRAGQHGGHLADGVRLTAAGVVRGEGRGPPLPHRLQSRRVRRRHIVDVDEVAPLAAVLVDPGGLAARQGGAEERGDTGVRGVARHARPVHVVVAQGHRPAAGGPRPGGGQVLLGQLGRRVHVARIRRRVLGHQPGRQFRPAVRAARLEAPRPQVGLRARTGADRAVPGAVVAPFPVDHHGSGQHQVPDPGRRHLRQQHRRTEVVAPHVQAGVREVLAEADQGRLVAYGVHPGQRVRHRLPVPDVPDDHPVARQPGGRSLRMGRGQQCVQHHVLVPGRGEGGDDMCSDEPGSAGDQYAHDRQARARRPAGRGPARVRQRTVRTSGRRSWGWAPPRFGRTPALAGPGCAGRCGAGAVRCRAWLGNTTYFEPILTERQSVVAPCALSTRLVVKLRLP